MTLLKMFSIDNRGYDYDSLVELECNDCFIRVCGFRVEDDPRTSSMYIALQSFHNDTYRLTWKYKIRQIWRILRAAHDPEIEIMTSSVVNSLAQALEECKQAVFEDR